MTSLHISRARCSRSGTRSTPMTRQSRRWCATRHAIEPIGPRPRITSVPPVGDVGVLDRLPGGRQHVGQVDVALVGPVLRAP